MSFLLWPRRLFAALVALVLIGSAARPAAAQAPAVDALWQQYQQGRFGQVVDEGTALLDERPDDPTLHLVIGRALVDDGQHARSVTHLEQADALDAEDTWITAWALNFLGKAHFAEGQPAAARTALQRSVDLRATRNATRSSARWLKTFGLTPRYDAWATVETEHFVFHFAPSLQEVDHAAFAERRDAAFQEIAAFFGTTLPHPARFFVWRSNEEAQAAGLPPLGFARPAYHLVHARVNQTVGHEITHLAVYHGAQPTQRTGLINEGLAVYFDQSGRDRYATARSALAAAGRTTVSIETLWTDWASVPPRVSYPVAGAFVHHLIERGGPATIKQLARHQTLDRAQQIYGDDLARYMAEVERRIQP